MRAKPKPLRETLAANRRGERDWAAMFGKPVRAEHVEPALRKRTMAQQREVNATVRGEAAVQKEILALLHRHPKVAFVERHNSGQLPDRTGRLVRFNSVRAQGQRGALISDITGHLKDGRPYAIECKAENWGRPDFAAIAQKDGLLSEKNMRELGQEQYLSAIRNIGGIGIFATCIDDVIKALGDA